MTDSGDLVLDGAPSGETPRCELCGEPMPPGEEMFKYHGYSGDCPKPPLPTPSAPREEPQPAPSGEAPRTQPAKKLWSTPACPEHGDFCHGATCCCVDKHPVVSPPAGEALEALERLKVFGTEMPILPADLAHLEADYQVVKRALSGLPQPTPLRLVNQKGPLDCFTACLASLTGIPLDDFPSPPEVRERATEVAYNNAIQSLLIDRGWMKVTTWRRAPMGYAVATGPSPRDPAISHCVIVRDGKLVHDPHPDKIGIAVAEEFEVLVPLALSPSVPQQETCEQRVPWAGHVEKLPCGHELPCPFHGPIDHD